MKKVGVGIILLGLLTGCAQIKYISKEGETFKYSRLGTQKISGFKLVTNNEGTTSVEFENQEGTSGDVAETMKNISEILITASKKVP